MKNLILLLLLFFCSGLSFASQRLAITSIENFTDAVLKKTQSHSVKDILIVYDIDSTLLTMEKELGSDQWYNWQAELLKNNNKTAIARDFPELFRLQGMLLALGKMRLIETNAPELVGKIQKQGFKSIVLTSRGPNYRFDVEEEFERAGFDFTGSAFGPTGGYPGTFLPEGIEKPRPISFMNGVAMGSGQNKGKILRALLTKTGASFKAIYFLDDTLRNIEDMEAEFQKETELFTFHYTALQKDFEKFEKNKKSAIRDWNLLRPVLQSVFGYRPR